ncbi:MAG: hypothetical protein ACE5FK_01405 [Candidatus Methylomirabilia bacterium]
MPPACSPSLRGNPSDRQLRGLARMIHWSALAILLGVGGTWLGVKWLDRQQTPRPPEVDWLLGLLAFFPAWLIPFLSLLGRSVETLPEASVAVWAILSASAGLLGAIVTDAVVRHLRGSAEPERRMKYWAVGLAALVPAWGIALVGVLLTSGGEVP